MRRDVELGEFGNRPYRFLDGGRIRLQDENEARLRFVAQGRHCATNGRLGTVDVFLRSAVRVDLHSPKAGHTLDVRAMMADGLLEDVRQVGGRVRGHDQGRLALIAIVYGCGTGHLCLAKPALAREEWVLRTHRRFS